MDLSVRYKNLLEDRMRTYHIPKKMFMGKGVLGFRTSPFEIKTMSMLL